MAITLDTLTLPQALIWTDEFAWSNAVASAGVRTIHGRLVIQTATIPGMSGRPVTLGNEHAWLPRADLLTLQTWAGQGLEHALTLHDGRSFQVRFRLQDIPVIEAEPVDPCLGADPQSADQWRLIALKLVAV